MQAAMHAFKEILKSDLAGNQSINHQSSKQQKQAELEQNHLFICTTTYLMLLLNGSCYMLMHAPATT
jgi:hypothetical protein